MSRQALLALALLLSVAGCPVAAHDGSSHGASPKETSEPQVKAVAVGLSEEERARNYFTDLPVITQHGEELRFFSDVLKDRVVLISLFFRNCKQACPLTTAKLAAVQDLLGADLGDEVFLISVTLDPENDTPETLTDYAAKFEAREGWLFLTGEPTNLRQITRRLGHTGDQIDAHGTQYFLGNVKIARWTKIAPNSPPELIVERVRQIANYSKEQ